MELIVSALVLAPFLWLWDRHTESLLFYDQTCRYCVLGVYWDRRGKRWLHEGGEQHADTPGLRIYRWRHAAMPGDQYP